jgi:hypothetical protein
VAHADTLTPTEAAACRARLCADLSKVGLSHVEPCLQGRGGFLAAHSCELPLIIGSGQQVEGGHPVRHYPWGSFRPVGYLLFDNGVLDMYSFKTLDFSPDDCFTKKIHGSFCADAELRLCRTLC